MTAKRTMTLNLTDAEMRVLDDLSARKDITKTAVLRQALRLYQTIDARSKGVKSSCSRMTRPRKRRS